MMPIAVASYECLAKDQFNELIVPELSNQLRDVPTATPNPHTWPLMPGKVRHTYATRYDEIAVEQLGFTLATKTQRAVSLYLRGATTAEIVTLNGAPYLNCLKRLQTRGYRVSKLRVPSPNGRIVTRYKIEV